MERENEPLLRVHLFCRAYFDMMLDNDSFSLFNKTVLFLPTYIFMQTTLSSILHLLNWLQYNFLMTNMVLYYNHFNYFMRGYDFNV